MATSKFSNPVRSIEGAGPSDAASASNVFHDLLGCARMLGERCCAGRRRCDAWIRCVRLLMGGQEVWPRRSQLRECFEALLIPHILLFLQCFAIGVGCSARRPIVGRPRFACRRVPKSFIAAGRLIRIARAPSGKAGSRF